jgi:hypothetical protein
MGSLGDLVCYITVRKQPEMAKVARDTASGGGKNDPMYLVAVQNSFCPSQRALPYVKIQIGLGCYRKHTLNLGLNSHTQSQSFMSKILLHSYQGHLFCANLAPNSAVLFI